MRVQPEDTPMLKRAIPADGRLNLLIRRAAEHARNATLIAKLSPDVEQKLKRPTHPRDPSDARTLRGIPVSGFGGAIALTRPEGKHGNRAWDDQWADVT